jgi:hypothetical protein
MSRDPALPRFVLLQLVRLGGALITLLGVVILSGGQPALAGIPAPVGGALIVMGAVEFFFVPFALAKSWKGKR